MAAELGKGSRVEVARGKKSVGVIGTIFWVGDTQWGEGKRTGIEGDDGETYWIALEHLDPSATVMPEIEPPARGSRVRFEFSDVMVEGEVFWVGPSKSGNGWRVGVKDASDEPHWLDARAVTPVVPAADGIDEADVPF